MAIKIDQNLYQGVNAHFQSFCQAHNDWESFHSSYINHLAETISLLLPEGYLVKPEKSIQIREYHPDTGKKIIIRKKPDLTIYERQITSAPAMAGLTLSPATMVIPTFPGTELDRASYLTSLVLYEIQPDSIFGKPIAQIEVLSPTNKPPNEGAGEYHDKRLLLLRSGLYMVEIDFLHETASPIDGIPSYRNREENAYPYYVTLTDPYPALENGRTWVYGFGVDETLRSIKIPLTQSQTFEVDFGAIYSDTYERLTAYYFVVDYEQLPENFDTYTLADQEKIKQVMERAKTHIQS